MIKVRDKVKVIAQARDAEDKVLGQQGVVSSKSEVTHKALVRFPSSDRISDKYVWLRMSDLQVVS